MQTPDIVTQHEHKIEMLARLGFLARAVNYATIGILAIQVAFSQGGKLTDSQGVFQTLASQPMGKLLLLILALGFVGYAIWRLVQAFLGDRDFEDGPKGILKRIAFTGSGLLHLLLAGSAVKEVFFHTSANGNSARSLSAMVMSHPLGHWIVAGAGLILAGFGLQQFIKGFSDKFRENLSFCDLENQDRETFCLLAKWGILARGLVFCIMGWFLIQAAMTHNPNQARSLGGALYEIAAQPFGKVLLGLVALGLVLYAVYSAFKARYYRVAVAS